MDFFKTKITPYICEIIFSIFFISHYIPYFIIAPVPILMHDTQAYVLMSMVFENIISIENINIDLPYGLSFIIWIFFKLGFSLKAVVLLQVCLSFLSSVFLINSLKKVLRPVFLLIFTLLFSAFITNSDVMQFNTAIFTESFYTSSLILLTAFICQLWTKGSTSSILGICFSVLLLIFFRSTGVMYLYIPLFIVGFYYYKRSLVYKKALLFIIILLLISSSTNMIVKGYFFPGDYNRISENFSSEEKEDTEILKDKKWIKGEVLDSDRIINGYNLDQIYREKQRGLTFIKLISGLAEYKKSHYYYYRLPYNLKHFNKDSIVLYITENRILSSYLNIDFPVNEYVDYLLKNYEEIPVTEKTLSLLNTNKRPRNPTLFGIHVFHELQFFFRNWLIVALANLLLLASFYVLFIRKQEKYLLPLLISSIYYSKLLAMTILARPIDRYVQVAEFALYLFIVLSLSYLLKDSNLKNLKRIKHAPK